MAIAKVSETEVDTLLKSGCLTVSGSCTWKQGAEKSWFKSNIDVRVMVQKPPKLRIIVSVSFLDKSRYNFVLLWNNIRVRSLDVNGSHANHHTNDECWVHSTHKHRWTDKCHDRFAYTPTDITATDIPGQLAQFCAECGIDCSVKLAELPMATGGIFDDL